MKPSAFFSLGGLALGLLLLSGCSTPQTRAQENTRAFAALPKKHRQAALKGEVAEGMSSDAVYVALGKPNRISKGQEKGVRREYWIYTEPVTREIPAWREISGQIPSDHQNAQSISYRQYDPIEITRWRDSFEVIFQKGKVVGWRAL